MKRVYAIALALGFLISAGSAGWAQQGGINNAEITQVPLAGDRSLINMREEMRKFVQSISTYARNQKPNFIILANGGLDLLVKRDPIEETRVSPARTYMRALDGIVQEGLFFDVARKERPFGAPPLEERQKSMLGKITFAKRNGLKIFSIDFGSTKAVVDAAYKQAKKRGYVSFVANAPTADTFELPKYPPRPFDENPSNILALNMVRNFAVLRNSVPFGRMDQFALKMHETNYDMLAVEVFHGRKPLSRQAVETLKYKKIGAKRLVLAYMDIGSAASYYYYWRPEWREGSPPWIVAAMRDDPDRYNVEYWQNEWQQIFVGDTSSYIYGLIAQGFDGVIIDGLEAYTFFEDNNDDEEG